MITVILSEWDFDYELQALVTSFYPGQKCRVCAVEGLKLTDREALFSAAGGSDTAIVTEESLCIGICFGAQEIAIGIASGRTWRYECITVKGGDDWHKHADKSAHPYRTYYKNEWKRLLFLLLRELPQEELPEGMHKRVPEWGTMTGVRPTKIPMNQLLQGKSYEEVADDLEKWYCCTPQKQKLCLDIAVREAELLREVDFVNGYSLYIGIPFCPTTCLYCSFPSYPYEKFGHLSDAYLQALKKEIIQTAKACRGHKLTSVYMGGGTPTALSAAQLEELLCCVRECFPVRESYEFTVEAGRPDSITREKLLVLRKYQVERISVNPQTMQQKTLDLIGRRHTAEETQEAFRLARDCGFSNINMDLIIGLPGETPEDFADTLRSVRELKPDSLTVHSLVVKRASRLRSVLEEMGDFAAEEAKRSLCMEKMLQMAQEFAQTEGYVPYYMYRQKNSAGHAGSSGQENIGYAKEGCECLYNILIMEEMQTILAVGAGASTKCYHPRKKIVSRIENVKSITDYIDRIDEMIERKTSAIFAD